MDGTEAFSTHLFSVSSFTLSMCRDICSFVARTRHYHRRSIARNSCRSLPISEKYGVNSSRAEFTKSPSWPAKLDWRSTERESRDSMVDRCWKHPGTIVKSDVTSLRSDML